MIRDASRDYDDTTTRDVSWWGEIGGEGPKPYETKAWSYAIVEVEEDGSCDPSAFEDPDDLTCEVDEPWWQQIGGEGPKPYETAAWTFTTKLVAEVDEDISEDSITFEAFTAGGEWWETLGDEGPKPYEYAAWTFTTYVIDEIREFVAVSKTLFSAFDETYFDRTPLGLVLDSGYFGQIGTDVYDEAFFLGDERGVLVKRTISRLMVYDSKAFNPGPLGAILQPIGHLGTDPEATVAETVTDPDEDFIELTRNTTFDDDIPPGVLLGSVSYETFNSVLTITDWEHLNWEDDTPVLMGVKTLLSQIPDGIVEVRVLDPPHAFWTSLGFEPDYKGDPYLHIHL